MKLATFENCYWTNGHVLLVQIRANFNPLRKIEQINIFGAIFYCEVKVLSEQRLAAEGLSRSATSFVGGHLVVNWSVRLTGDKAR